MTVALSVEVPKTVAAEGERWSLSVNAGGDAGVAGTGEEEMERGDVRERWEADERHGVCRVGSKVKPPVEGEEVM